MADVVKSRHTWTDTEVAQMKADYESGQGLNEISKKIGVKSSDVYLQLKKKTNVVFRSKTKIQPGDIEKIIALYNQGQTYEAIGNQFGITKSMVMNYVRRSNAEPHKKNWMKKHSHNESYFHDINTERKAYWLGFMLGDGCVHITNTAPTVQLLLSIKDKVHIETFKADLNSTSPIAIGKARNSKLGNHIIHSGENCSIRIFSREMYNDLISHGCIENKSLRLKYPVGLPDRLFPHFVRGLFDSDGSITNGQNIIFRLMGTESLLLSVQNKMMVELNLSKTTLYSKTTVFELSYGGRFQVLDIYKWMYKDATIFLERKRKMFEDIKTGTLHTYNYPQTTTSTLSGSAHILGPVPTPRRAGTFLNIHL